MDDDQADIRRKPVPYQADTIGVWSGSAPTCERK